MTEPVWLGIQQRLEDVLRLIKTANGYHYDLGDHLITHGRDAVPLDAKGDLKLGQDFTGLFIDANAQATVDESAISKQSDKGVALMQRDIEIHGFTQLKDLQAVDAWLVPAERLKLDIKQAVMSLNQQRIKGLHRVLPVEESMSPPAAGERLLKVAVTFEFHYMETYQ